MALPEELLQEFEVN